MQQGGWLICFKVSLQRNIPVYSECFVFAPNLNFVIRDTIHPEFWNATRAERARTLRHMRVTTRFPYSTYVVRRKSQNSFPSFPGLPFLLIPRYAPGSPPFS
jgi:hypothetical protein